MILVQVLMNNKYVGYFVCIVVLFLSDLIFLALDIQSNMLSIGASPINQYSDMNGFGPAMTAMYWFNIYWLLFSGICLMIASALWSRGMIGTMKERIAKARINLGGGSKLALGTMVVCWLLVTGFVYYNTQILNPYKTADELEELTAEFERTYKKYEAYDQPKIKDVKYKIDIFPEERAVDVEATMILKNESTSIIDSLFYNVNEKWNPQFNLPNAKLALRDTLLGWRIFELSEPIKPGDSIVALINTNYVAKGFENQVSNMKVLANGTFFNNFDILPGLGYDPSS